VRTGSVTDRLVYGMLDTSVVIDIAAVPHENLPLHGAISAVTLAELAQGVHLARDERARAARVERLQLVEAMYRAPLPFDDGCARRYGSLVALVLAAGGQPKPRRIDLMIAATAANQDLPLFTRNPRDFAGLERAVLVVPA